MILSCNNIFVDMNLSCNHILVLLFPVVAGKIETLRNSRGLNKLFSPIDGVAMETL